MLQQALMNIFETNEKIGSLRKTWKSQQRYTRYKEESNGNFRTKKNLKIQ